MESTKRWKKAIFVAKHASSLSQSFCTLRDMAQDVFIDPATITQFKKLGEGTFASVDLCTWEGKTVAVKTLKSSLLQSERDLKDFFHEAALLKKLKHPSIVGFVGVAIDVKSPTEDTTSTQGPRLLKSKSSISRKLLPQLHRLITLKSARSIDEDIEIDEKEEVDSTSVGSHLDRVMLVQEYMSRGTLKQMVTDQMASPLRPVYTKQQGLEWLIQIAQGLKYLHHARPAIIHRDLKLENIMLAAENDGSVVAKIGDFGLHAVLKQPKEFDYKEPSTLCKSDSLTFHSSLSAKEYLSSIKASYDLSGRTGSMMYMAPEVLYCQPYNEKSDVFSFAIIMYEILSKTLLLAFVCNRGLPDEVENYAKGIARGNRPKVPEDWPESFSTLLRQCWAQKPEERPSMATIVTELTKLRDDEWISAEYCHKTCGCCALQ